MSGRNPIQGVTVKPCISEALNTATTLNGTGVDCLGFDRCGFVLSFGTVTITGAGTLTMTLEESADNSSFAAVTGFSIVTGTLASGFAKTTKGAFSVNCQKRLRYLRCVLVTTQANTLLNVSVVALLGGGSANSPDLAGTYVEVDIG